MCAQPLQLCPTFCDPWTVAHQAPLFMEFFGQEYWSGLPCSPPKDLPNPGTEPRAPVLPALQAHSLPLSHLGNPVWVVIFASQQFLFNRSVGSDSLWPPWTAACQASLSFTISQSFLKLMSIESVMPSTHLILCHLLLLPSEFPSIRIFFNESALCIRWSKYWSFSFSISPSNEYSVLISFRVDWLDLLVVQGNLKSLFQHHSSKASILQCLAFFMVHRTPAGRHQGNHLLLFSHFTDEKLRLR